MSAKMKEARIGSMVFDVNKYETNKPNGQLKCRFCKVDVIFVHTYPKIQKGKLRVVSRHFRLKQKQAHDDGCKYNIEGELLTIFAACADKEIMTRNGKRYVVRLLLTDKVKDSVVSDLEKNGAKAYGQSVVLNYFKSNKELVAYLSTMGKILKLRSLLLCNEDMMGKLDLEYYDGRDAKLVPWNYFYFDLSENDYSKLLDYLRNREVPHPICVEGEISKVIKDTISTQKSYQKDGGYLFIVS